MPELKLFVHLPGGNLVCRRCGYPLHRVSEVFARAEGSVLTLDIPCSYCASVERLVVSSSSMETPVILDKELDSDLYEVLIPGTMMAYYMLCDEDELLWMLLGLGYRIDDPFEIRKLSGREWNEALCKSPQIRQVSSRGRAVLYRTEGGTE